MQPISLLGGTIHVKRPEAIRYLSGYENNHNQPFKLNWANAPTMDLSNDSELEMLVAQLHLVRFEWGNEVAYVNPLAVDLILIDTSLGEDMVEIYFSSGHPIRVISTYEDPNLVLDQARAAALAESNQPTAAARSTPSAPATVRDTIGPSKFLRDIRLTELPGMPHVKMLQNRAVATVGGFLDLTRERMIGGIPELALYNIFLWMIQQNLIPDPKITDMAGSASIFSSAIMIMRLERIDDMSIIRTLKSSYPHLDWQAYGL